MSEPKRPIERLSVCGTRAVRKSLQGFAVICATCDEVKSEHKTRESATRKATLTSGDPCRACGAE